jgi:hypothetical protein
MPQLKADPVSTLISDPRAYRADSIKMLHRDAMARQIIASSITPVKWEPINNQFGLLAIFFVYGHFGAKWPLQFHGATQTLSAARPMSVSRRLFPGKS